MMFLASAALAQESEAWFYPAWVQYAPYNHPLQVKDTDSALGRYNIHTKNLDLKTLTKAHGHLCDGLTIAYVELSAVLKKIFPDGVVDRTDVRVVAKNSPCLVDAAALTTGARINFKTLSVDNSVGLGYIVQRISTGKTYEVHLKKGIFPQAQHDFEHKIRDLRKEGKAVEASQIDKAEAMANDLIKKILNTNPAQLLEIKELPNYQFNFTTKDFGKRSDIINKNMPRTTPTKAQKISWLDDYDEALTLAKAKHMPLLVFMSQEHCGSCKYMKQEVFSDAKMIDYVNAHFIPLMLDINGFDVPKSLQTTMTPVFHFLDENGHKLRKSLIGGKTALFFLPMLKEIH